ncbi:substrate-binding domain-containing protein [Curtobacterium flaccumfaciens]|uniref:substrate-binding domain-containing protein n=1 Tax=Curtobacterium flaccumfaciens TaxID=2035 RepID=UPI001E3E38D5|nr:substrate-binding domain-containing protein [Curtobacterium allii]MCE0459706.1 substrate-binding domain-containing protein [Curtobacterium allii]
MKLTTRLTAVALTAMLGISLAACTNPALEKPSTTSQKLPSSCSTSKPVIGVSLPNTTNPYYVAMQNSFKSNAPKLGFGVKVAIANDSDTNQLAQVQSFIQQGVCAVALNAVNSGPGAASVRALNTAGIPVFSVNVIISPSDLKTQNASYVEYVGADNTAGGRQMGEQALKDFGKDAKMTVGIIGNPDQLPTNQRDQGFKDALKGNPNAMFVQTVNGKIDPNISLQVTGDMLQAHSDINVIFADAGPHATGALQAISQQNKGDKVKVYAFCAADTPLTDTYAGCAAQEPADYAKTTLENMKTYISGKKVPHQVKKPLKVFVTGQTPGEGEVG